MNIRLREWKSRCMNTCCCASTLAVIASNTPSSWACCAAVMVTPRCLPTNHSGNRFISRSTKARSKSGSTPGWLLSWNLISASTASEYMKAALSASSRCQVGGGAEVGQQQEAVRHVARDDGRHVDAGVQQQAGDVDEGRHVFALGRRVHGDQGRRPACPAGRAARRAGSSGGNWRRTRPGGGCRPGPVQACRASWSVGPGGRRARSVRRECDDNKDMKRPVESGGR